MNTPSGTINQRVLIIASLVTLVVLGAGVIVYNRRFSKADSLCPSDQITCIITTPPQAATPQITMPVFTSPPASTAPSASPSTSPTASSVAATGDLSILVFEDKDASTLQSSDEGPLADVELTITSSVEGSYSNRLKTDSTGRVDLHNLTAGDYRVLETVPTGYKVTTPNPLTVTVESGQTKTVKFGDQKTNISASASPVATPSSSTSSSIKPSPSKAASSSTTSTKSPTGSVTTAVQTAQQVAATVASLPATATTALTSNDLAALRSLTQNTPAALAVYNELEQYVLSGQISPRYTASQILVAAQKPHLITSDNPVANIYFYMRYTLQTWGKIR